MQYFIIFDFYAGGPPAAYFKINASVLLQLLSFAQTWHAAARLVLQSRPPVPSLILVWRRIRSPHIAYLRWLCIAYSLEIRVL